MDDSMQQRSERHVHADFRSAYQIAGGKAGRVADMQLRYSHAGPGEESRMNRAESDFPPRLFRDGVGDRVAIAIDIQEIGHGQRDE